MKRIDLLLARAVAALPARLHAGVVVFGSAPMVMAGLRPDVNDLDLFVSAETFTDLIVGGRPPDELRPGVPRIVLAEDVEVFKTWLGVEFPEVYAASAPREGSCGLRVAALRHVLAFKTARNGEKDLGDIEILRRALAL